MKKRVAILIYSLASGGAERVVSILLHALKDEYDLTLVLMNDTCFYPIPKDIQVVYLENSNPHEHGIKKLLKLPLLGWRYKKLLHSHQFDLSISLMTRPNYINSLAKLLGSGVRTIISERSMFSLQYSYKNLQSFINRYLVKLYNMADLIVTNSYGNREDLIESFQIQPPMTTIYNPLDLEQIQHLKDAPIPLEKERFTFVTVGRLDAGKNHQLLIEAIQPLNADLWIIGDGPLKEDLSSKIAELGLQERVKLLGRQKNPYAYLAKADAFLFGSNHEGFPNVLLEALACELPIISTDCKSGPREILAPDTDFRQQTQQIEMAHYGLLVPVGDVTQMREAMQKMVEDEKLRKELKKRAYERAKDFAIEKIVEQWRAVIDKKLDRAL